MMVSLEIAARGKPSLVLTSSVFLGFLQRHQILADLRNTTHDARALEGDVVVKITLDDGTMHSDEKALTYLAKLWEEIKGQPTLSAVEEWLARSAVFGAATFQSLRAPLEDLNRHLMLRSHVIGYDLTLADLAVWAAISSNHVAASSIRKAKNSITRWYSYIGESNPWLEEVLTEALATSSKDKAAVRAAASAAGASYDIDLPQVFGPIITRFPPEPSGYLHIGHAKAALLNEYFARLRDGGRLICRFDDTNPTRETEEFQDSILTDLKLIGIVPDQISYSSDYFQVMYNFALTLIRDGNAFADDSVLGKGDKDRKHRLPSKNRDMGIEETLQRFEQMRSGSNDGIRWAIRTRITYDSPNGTLRDPVIYRCNSTPHHRTGSSWNIYPTYDFCAPILDSIEGVTVALRTNEYRDRNEQYAWIQAALGLRPVPIWDFSRLNFVRTVLSKRKLAQIVEDGRVQGWDDPRMPTIRGVLRRGVVSPALREFILKQGPSRNVLNLEWGAFWSINRKHIDPEAARHTAIASSAAVFARVHGISEITAKELSKHPKNLSLGRKKVVYSPDIVLEQTDVKTFDDDEEITLMNWGNAFVRNISKDSDGVITTIDLHLSLEGDHKTTKKKVTWLADSATNLVAVDLISFDHLITKIKLEKQDHLEDFLTPVTEFCTRAHADCNVAELSKGAIVQFERKGFYKLDVAYGGEGSRAIFFGIPAK